MTKLILSTGNIVSGGPSIIRKPGAYRSNFELTNSLRSNFLAAQQAALADIEAEAEAGASHGEDDDAAAATNGTQAHGATPGSRRRPPLDTWTQREGAVLYVPRLDWADVAETDAGAAADADTALPGPGLQEEASQYETTAKLFFVSGARAATAAERGALAEEALAHVFRELGVDKVDLLVVSFPGESGDVEDEDQDTASSAADDTDDASTWAATAEALHARGLAARLGVAEFGAGRLARLLARAHVPPAVDQVNLRRCCSVPAALATLATTHGIELLVHTDCTDVLPPGTLRELLGPGLHGAGVLASGPAVEVGATEPDEAAGGGEALCGNLTPQWVVKYTAVVRDRGVIENMGYFAGATLDD